MLQVGTRVIVMDNTGARVVECISIFGSKKTATVGDVILVSVKKYKANRKVKKGQIFKALITRVKLENRIDGLVRFEYASVVLLGGYGQLLGTRLFGPVSRGLRNLNYSKVLSLASDVF